MNIYCIRDRLLDYFQDPFVAPNDYNVQASVSNAINNPGVTNAIAQAPHHFEIWRIATVDDQGHINESREFIGDCAALVRTGRDGTEPTGGSAPETAPQQTRGHNSPQPRLAAPEQAAGHKVAPKSPKTAKRTKTARRGSN